MRRRWEWATYRETSSPTKAGWMTRRWRLTPVFLQSCALTYPWLPRGLVQYREPGRHPRRWTARPRRWVPELVTRTTSSGKRRRARLLRQENRVKSLVDLNGGHALFLAVASTQKIMGTGPHVCCGPSRAAAGPILLVAICRLQPFSTNSPSL